jgi:hypothetical protein
MTIFALFLIGFALIGLAVIFPPILLVYMLFIGMMIFTWW